MNEDNAENGQEATNGSDDISKLQAKNGEIIGKNKELKEQIAQFSSQVTSLEEKLNAVGTLFGVQEGEDIVTKAQAQLKAKEQEAYDKLTDNEKLAQKVSQLEEYLNSEKLAKEKATKEAIGLRIDDKLKNTLQEFGVKDSAKLNAGLTLLKSSNAIQGIDGDTLILDGGKMDIKSLTEGFLSSNRFLIDNPSKSGSGFNGGSVADGSAINFKKSLQNKDFVGAISQVLTKNSH